jgi:hypothetical protein
MHGDALGLQHLRHGELGPAPLVALGLDQLAKTLIYPLLTSHFRETLCFGLTDTTSASDALPMLPKWLAITKLERNRPWQAKFSMRAIWKVALVPPPVPGGIGPASDKAP